MPDNKEHIAVSERFFKFFEHPLLQTLIGLLGGAMGTLVSGSYYVIFVIPVLVILHRSDALKGCNWAIKLTSYVWTAIISGGLLLWMGSILESHRNHIPTITEIVEAIKGTTPKAPPPISTATDGPKEAVIPKPEKAKLRFSLSGDPKIEPITTDTLRVDENGAFVFRFVVRNTSDVPANQIDIWAEICESCTIQFLPPGFDIANGSTGSYIHKHIESLNAGVAFGYMEVHFKSSEKADSFPVSFAASCENCGKLLKEKPFKLIVPQ